MALEGYHVVNLAPNVPAPAAAARLRDLGARVTKVNPPQGDLVERVCPAWYAELTAGMNVVSLNLKEAEGAAEFGRLLDGADLLLTASLPASLERMGLGWETLHRRYPRLCQVAIVGFPPPRENVPGHDLTYQAELGLVSPGELPRVLVADLAGAEWAASAALALLLERERGGEAGYRTVALSDAGASFARAWRYGLTNPSGPLGGQLPQYGVYAAKRGHVALAALEAHFLQRLLDALGRTTVSCEELAAVFAERDAVEWEAWAQEHGIPLAVLAE